MTRPTDSDLLVDAYGRLRDLLEQDGDESVKLVDDGRHGDGSRDAVWRVETMGRNVELIVQAYARFTPRRVDQLIGGVSRLMQNTRDQSILVVAPWLSARSREQLSANRLNYLDLTGNIGIRIPRLPIVVRTDGAINDPFPADRPRRGLQGRSANALVRVLADFAPPYRMSELAKTSGLSPAYVSRLMDVLDEERLIERDAKRVIVDVDWPRLLHERARHYRLTKSNSGKGYVARSGLAVIVRSLGIDSGEAVQEAEPASMSHQRAPEPLLTGSFAVQQHVRLAAPAQLALYVTRPDEFARRHGLLPTESGANVLLLKAAHGSQIERPRLIDGVLNAGLSQVALDCLGGNGRLPEEGAALIEWMRSNEGRWREPNLPDQ